MRKLRSAIALAVLLAGCAPAGNVPIYTADGAPGHRIDCSGYARNWGHCVEQAGAICKAAGYTVLSRTDERATPTDVGLIPAIVDATGPARVARSMVIRCNEAPG